MAERSGPSRILACILVGLGAFLLAVAILIPTYTVGKLEKTPLDLEVTTIAEGSGSVLNSQALLAGKAEVNTNVPLVSQRYVTTEDPANADVVTLQAGQTLRRTDKQGDTGLLSAIVDRNTVDRQTSMPTNDPVGTIQTQPNQPAEEVPRDGLQYKFPFNAEQKSYPYFDLSARATQDINFVEETEINGLKVYHYNQTIEPVDLSKVVNSPTNKLTLPAEAWGVPGGTLPVTMTRWYTNVRDLWVEPETGVVVKGQEQLHQYYARNKARPEIDVLKVELPFNEETIEYQVQQARDGMDKISTFGRTVPIIAGILGLIALIAGIILGLRGGKGPQPARTTGGGVPPAEGGRHYEGSDAPTEQHDWTTDKTEEIPVADPRRYDQR
ncbi:MULTISPECIES: DUF3068 domain-containing protein [Rhodococcus]|jgi:hypothetical protein|uniref:DUF3068 domain-containing protein n=1 Tax=Rhodococcus oxybenzonivorans TaxID=1990687 RepID=A0A2S2C0K2_9NOCA|nr:MULTISPECIES: DUF3068 domain-containing protein [Rhodococcus]AWK74390.1 hypothetical protein CBI38_25365 [Rhodococcus oxybenzonivorans]MDV7246428.1 DUF3068 domain-containing protein [Rhodococcus oxybenzonivorans]MDV7265113.1 DUF3068 domain-containing protein [Rhodococcus oxybenzonivorans]MDV7277983.1 DUF3068 domain-containing protein [Rhodococcus oxybenzonivorans]MDV7337440.1 DUF3068 domain-containing protein [Rhodococcus oxybenzonivorans]